MKVHNNSIVKPNLYEKKKELNKSMKKLKFTEAYYLLNEVDLEKSKIPNKFEVKDKDLNLIFKRSKNDRILLEIKMSNNKWSDIDYNYPGLHINEYFNSSKMSF